MTKPSVKPLTVEGVTVTPTWPWSAEYRARVKAEMSSSRFALPQDEAARRYQGEAMTRRRFHRRIYLGVLRRQKLLCICGCGVKFTRAEGYQFDHITALALGGADTPENLRAVRTPCHKKISATDIRMIRKADRQRKFHEGAKKRRGRALQSRGFSKRLRRRFDGTVEVRG